MTTYILKFKSFIEDFFLKGHERSIKAKKNILASILIKGSSVLISLVVVPLTINYINPSRYGIWLTLSSIVAWFSFFDIGLTQGLRNKFAEAKAKGEDHLAKIYISTTYAILSIIFFIVWLLFLAVNNFLDWSRILKISESMRSEVSVLAIIVFTYFCISFVIKIITTVLIADQKPAKASLIDLLGQIVSLVFIVILVKTTKGSLINLGIAFCVSPLIILIGANIVLFTGSYRKYRPEISKVDFSHAKELFNLGIIFFILQITYVLQFETANIIIARFFSTADVTSYNIVYKYFGVLNMGFMIFLTPFWSASTEAYQKNDIQWIRNSIKRYNQLNIVMVLIGCLMLILSSTVYTLWLGKGTVNIEFSLSLFGFLFFNTSIFGGKYVSFLNGISALRIQLIACIISPFLYMATALILLKYTKIGVPSLYIAAIITNFNTFLLAPIQYHMIIVKNRKGIWTK
jgi:O-antigen/teichoic acid export membrane protein